MHKHDELTKFSTNVNIEPKAKPYGQRQKTPRHACTVRSSSIYLTNTESAKGRNRKHHLWMPSRSAQVAMQTMKVITLDKMIWFWHFNPIHRNTSVERVTSSRFTISENQTKKCLFTLGYCLFHFSSSIATAFFVLYSSRFVG